MTLPHEIILALSQVHKIDMHKGMGKSKKRIQQIDLIVAEAKLSYPHLFKEEK